MDYFWVILVLFILGYIIWVVLSSLVNDNDKPKEPLKKDIVPKAKEVEPKTSAEEDDTSSESDDTSEPVKKEFDINDINIRNIDPDHLDGYLMDEKKAILEKYYRVVADFHAKKVVFLDDVKRTCPNDGNILFLANVLYKGRMFKDVLCCQHCKTIYHVVRQDFVIDFIDTSHYLYVVKSCDACDTEEHHTIAAQGLISGLKFKHKVVDIHYCCDCDRYFITYAEYLSLKDDSGGCVLANLKCVKYLWDDVEVESPLYLCGYNVSKQKGLKPEERRRILNFVMDNDVLTRAQVEDYIVRFIHLRKNRPTMEAAVSKWLSDLEWLHSNDVQRRKAKR